MGIFGPEDTRNYKKLAKEIYNTEVRLANTFCRIYGSLHNTSMFNVMDMARPYGDLLYKYGAILVFNSLEENGHENEYSIMVYYFAKIHKDAEYTIRSMINENPRIWRYEAITKISCDLFGFNDDRQKQSIFSEFFDEVEALVDKWERDEFPYSRTTHNRRMEAESNSPFMASTVPQNTGDYYDENEDARNPRRIICLDVETTDKDTNVAEILQLSIIDYDGNVLFNKYIKPNHATKWPGAERVNHISPATVSTEHYLDYYHDILDEIFEEAELIVAYNGDHYDIPVIARHGFPTILQKKTYDVMLEFAPIYGAWDSYHGSYTWQKLNVCADYYGYSGEGDFHDSLEDVRATLYCYKQMTDEEDNESILRQ